MMAKFTKDINQKTTYIHKIECDKCKKQFGEKDFIDWQECVCISMVGGYGSVFGDESSISLDLCQGCFKELCGDYVVVT